MTAYVWSNTEPKINRSQINDRKMSPQAKQTSLSASETANF